jgi:hypothetical protein
MTSRELFLQQKLTKARKTMGIMNNHLSQMRRLTTEIKLCLAKDRPLPNLDMARRRVEQILNEFPEIYDC